MTTDGLGQNYPSGLPMPQDGEQPQDKLLGQPRLKITVPLACH